MGRCGISLLLLPLLLGESCQRIKPTGTPTKPAPVAGQREPGRPDLYAQLGTYFESLISRRDIRIDTSWYANVDSSDRSPDAYSPIFRAQMGDDPPKFVDFPFSDLRFSYHEGNSQDYFLVRGQRLRETVYTSGNAFPLSSIRRFYHKGGSYLTFNGHLQQFNGYGDRINFNYFFDLSSNRVVADMYKNYWGVIYSPFLYGDLNDDNQLDRIHFDGIMYPQWGCADSAFATDALTCPDTITITAETYRKRKWRPLQDPAAKPYFIKLLAYEDRDTAVLIEHHWMREVHEPF